MSGELWDLQPSAAAEASALLTSLLPSRLVPPAPPVPSAPTAPHASGHGIHHRPSRRGKGTDLPSLFHCAGSEHFWVRSEAWYEDIQARAAAVVAGGLAEGDAAPPGRKLLGVVARNRTHTTSSSSSHAASSGGGGSSARDQPYYESNVWLDSRSQTLGCFQTAVEAAVAFDYAQSYLRSTLRAATGKPVNINFPLSASDCRIVPPIDPWPTGAEEAYADMPHHSGGPAILPPSRLPGTPIQPYLAAAEAAGIHAARTSTQHAEAPSSSFRRRSRNQDASGRSSSATSAAASHGGGHGGGHGGARGSSSGAAALPFPFTAPLYPASSPFTPPSTFSSAATADAAAAAEALDADDEAGENEGSGGICSQDGQPSLQKRRRLNVPPLSSTGGGSGSVVASGGGDSSRGSGGGGYPAGSATATATTATDTTVFSSKSTSAAGKGKGKAAVSSSIGGGASNAGPGAGVKRSRWILSPQPAAPAASFLPADALLGQVSMPELWPPALPVPQPGTGTGIRRGPPRRATAAPKQQQQQQRQGDGAADQLDEWITAQFGLPINSPLSGLLFHSLQQSPTFSLHYSGATTGASGGSSSSSAGGAGSGAAAGTAAQAGQLVPLISPSLFYAIASATTTNPASATDAGANASQCPGSSAGKQQQQGGASHSTSHSGSMSAGSYMGISPLFAELSRSLHLSPAQPRDGFNTPSVMAPPAAASGSGGHIASVTGSASSAVNNDKQDAPKRSAEAGNQHFFPSAAPAHPAAPAHGVSPVSGFTAELLPDTTATATRSA